jgi:hypothetical protein
MPRRQSPGSFFLDALTFAADSQAVIALRTFGLVTGQSSMREASLMISEKVEAAVRSQGAAAAAILSGRADMALPAAVAVYRRSARANRRRLTRPSKQ